MTSLPHKLLFRVRYTVFSGLSARLRTLWLRICGMKVAKHTLVPKISVTWPHQVKIGSNCSLEPDIFFKFDGIWSLGPSIIIGDNVFVGRGCEFNVRKRITIGQGSAIASGCKFIDHDHGITGVRIDESPGAAAEINIGDYVWLGCNVIVLKGVSIGSSAVVGAGAVVTKSIPASEIWTGIPAHKIGQRNC